MPRKRSVEETHCKTCANATYDPIWGEYKCTSLKHVIYKPDDTKGCIYYRKGEPAESKDSIETIYE